MRRPSAVILTIFALSCGQGLSCGNGCMALQPIPGGDFTGVRSDSAAAARLTSSGFDVVNLDAPALLEAIAPGGNLDIPLSCSIQNASLLGQLVVADEGALTCTQASCGYLDGKCDAQDVPKTISVHFNSFNLAPKGPDLVQATADVTLTTNGKIHMRTPGNSLLCILSGNTPIELSADLDTARTPPSDVTLGVGIQLTVDTRWWKLLTFTVSTIDGTKVCGGSGALPKPECIDAADLIIASENGCSGWLGTLGNVDIVKGLLIEQLTSTLQDKLDQALAKVNCRPCGDNGFCPTNGTAMSFCQVTDGGSPDAGVCFDPVEGRCVPKLVGVEGRIPVGDLLASAGAPAGAALDFSIAAGGAATASDAGLTLGFTGGALAVQTAACVKPLAEPVQPTLPLPDFDSEAAGPYDVGVSLSAQMLSRMLLHAQQSGALCLELGHDTISLLDSSLVATLLPSLNKLTQGQSVPLRVVIRPFNPPTATIGSGQGIEPLVHLDWDDVQIDLYALIGDRYTRLFTISFDLDLPLSLTIDGCATLTPVIGDLNNAVSDVHAVNSEMLAEPLTDLEKLVPSIIALAEPSLAKGLMGFTLPPTGGFQVRLLEAKGIANISGTQTYNHLGVYLDLLRSDGGTPDPSLCMGPMTPMPHMHSARWSDGDDGEAELDVGSDPREYSWRMPDGLWSRWTKPDFRGVLHVRHPRLRLDGPHSIGVRARAQGATPSLEETVSLSPRERPTAAPRRLHRAPVP